ncbi:HAD family hydrolase [Brachybacterium sp. UNK5269]|uniref:HAD family hydrolase n=1 Tax=Brachybacterium sp. UNK5269 TaxID=3408576 RepID=UPI003BAEDC2B
MDMLPLPLPAAPSAILFDFNGTLSLDEDLMGDLYIALACDLFGLRLTPEQYAEDYVGLSDPDISRAVASRAGAPHRADELLESLAARYAESIRAAPRIPASHVAVVRDLAPTNLPLGVVTGTLRRLVEPAIEAAGIRDLFAAVVAIEDVRQGKPHPEGFLRGFALLGADPSRGIVIEDSAAGIAAAAAAGSACVAVGSDRPRPGATATIPTVADLTRLLRGHDSGVAQPS